MKFWKMNGAGNDFIILDNRDGSLTPAQLGAVAAKLCPRRFAVGADGLMAVEQPTQGGDYKMRFFNADGTMGEMCGNGARCICRFGHDMGLAGDIQRVETTAGMVVGHRISENTYRVQLNNPSVFDVRPTSVGDAGYIELGNPGVPHCMFPVPGLKDKTFKELEPLGYALRHDPAFPKGANANLYDIVGPDRLVIRTYERGVEDFTYACGTGTGSLVCMLTKSGAVSGRNVQVENPGGTLSVDVTMENGCVNQVYLTGPAEFAFTGEAQV